MKIREDFTDYDIFSSNYLPGDELAWQGGLFKNINIEF